MLLYNDKECVVTGSVVVNFLWWGKVTIKNDYYKYTVIATLKLQCVTLSLLHISHTPVKMIFA